MEVQSDNTKAYGSFRKILHEDGSHEQIKPDKHFLIKIEMIKRDICENLLTTTRYEDHLNSEKHTNNEREQPVKIKMNCRFCERTLSAQNWENIKTL